MSGANKLYLGLASIMIVIILGSALIAPPAAYATSGNNSPKNGKDNHDKETKQKDRKDNDDKDKGNHHDHDKDCDINKYSKICKGKDDDKDAKKDCKDDKKELISYKKTNFENEVIIPMKNEIKDDKKEIKTIKQDIKVDKKDLAKDKNFDIPTYSNYEISRK